jgi:hypothetical protein
MPLTATSPRPPMLPCRRSMRRSVGVVEEEQVGNIHEAALARVEEGHMGEDEEKEDEDKDNNEANQLREEEVEEEVEEEEEEEEEDKDEESGGEGEEEDGKHHSKEDDKGEGIDGEEDKTSPIQVSPPNPNFSFTI